MACLPRTLGSALVQKLSLGVVCSARSCLGLQTEFCTCTCWVCFHPGFSWLLAEDGEESWLLTWGAATSGYLTQPLGAMPGEDFQCTMKGSSQGPHLLLGCVGSCQHGLILAKARLALSQLCQAWLLCFL